MQRAFEQLVLVASVPEMSLVLADDLPASITLHELIGRGSYGIVWSGTYNGNRSALKAVPTDDGMEEELRREVAMLASCNSEWVVGFVGSAVKGHTHWIATELCSGSVADVLRLTGQPLLAEEIAVIASAVARGLAYLHGERQVLHRDVKAGNVLITAEGGGGVKLCDLGVAASIAKAQQSGTVSAQVLFKSSLTTRMLYPRDTDQPAADLLLYTQVIGTPMWMSPELIESGSYGASTDVWSLGITLLEMAELAPPHAEVTPSVRALPEPSLNLP